MELVPYRSLEGIELGSSKHTIRNQVSAPFQEHRDILGQLHDSFESLGVSVYYDDQDKCEAFEATAPAQPTFQGISIIGQKYSEVQPWLFDQEVMQKKLLKAYDLADMSEYTFWERMK